MRLELQVVSERPNEYDGKKGHVKQIIIAGTDCSNVGLRLAHTVEYVLTEDEKTKYAGKLLDKRVNIDVTKIQQWSGAIRFEGRLVDFKV